MTRSWAVLPRKKVKKSVEGVKEVIYGEIRERKEDLILKKEKKNVSSSRELCMYMTSK